jgi:predicted nucleic acid-binding protein
MAVVADASALIVAVSAGSLEARRLRRRLGTEAVHAPHLVDAEIGNVLRRQVTRGERSAADGIALLRLSADLVDHRYEHRGALANAAWRLRHNVTFYDALYVALAAAIESPLLTADGRLAKAPGLPCAVEVVT